MDFHTNSDILSVTLNNIGCIRNGQPIFAKVNEKFDAGNIYALCGKNGCGKTSLLRIIANLLVSVCGEIIVNKKNNVTYHNLDTQDFVWVSHNNAIKKNLSGLDNLKFWASISKNGNEKNIEHAINTFKIDHVINNEAKQYSSGQMHRLALCKLFVSPAQIWLLDEPLNTLDRYGRDLLKQLILEHITNGGIVIMADHDLFLKSHCHIIEMDNYSLTQK